MKFDEGIFKAYDVRGLSPQELSPRLVCAIGRAFADFLDEGPVAVGRDMRSDSGELADALIEGLIKQGREVINIGMVTSDMIYFAVGEYGLAGGAMVTASHNPGQYNGIKFTGRGVAPIGVESGLKDIRRIVRDDAFKTPKQKGRQLDKNILGEWVNHTLRFASTELGSLHVGIDTGNGMAGIVLPRLQEQTNLDIRSLYVDLDGTFPNHPANPLEPANLVDLITLVRREGLDCGIAFDGDGDRAFFIDEKGEIVSGSQIGALLATTFLKENPGSTILYNAICSQIVPEVVEAHGGTAIRTRVGHSFIKAQMRQHKALFACEHSGHFYYRDNFNADSGLITAIMTLSVMSEAGKPLSELVAPFRKYADSGEINSRVADPAAVIKRVKQQYKGGKGDTLDGLTIRFKDWWFNVRPSNTEPVVRLNVETRIKRDNEARVRQLLSIIRG